MNYPKKLFFYIFFYYNTEHNGELKFNMIPKQYSLEHSIKPKSNQLTQTVT